MPEPAAAGNPPNNIITATAAGDFDDHIRELGDQIANLTLKEVQELSDYLSDVHGLDKHKRAAAYQNYFLGERVDLPPAEKESFDVILEGFDGAKKIGVIKTFREMTGMGLKESKDFVEGTPRPFKQGCSREEAEAIKAALEQAGGKVSIK